MSPSMIPAAWLKPGACVPVNAETVSLLLDALRASAPSAPLVAVSDAAIMKLIDAQYLNGAIRLTWENNSGERVLTDVCKQFTAGILEAAGQVAPQATVEPMTDGQILQQWGISDKTSLSKLDTILHFARALLAATPPTSKATPVSKESLPTDRAGEIKDHVVREAVNQLRDIASQYHAHQSLRERIADIVVPLVKSVTPSTIKEEPTGSAG